MCQFFFFNDTATTEIYTLSLHDALPICGDRQRQQRRPGAADGDLYAHRDRKSTRLNSSHEWISYAVFCLKKKKFPLDTILSYEIKKKIVWNLPISSFG